MSLPQIVLRERDGYTTTTPKLKSATVCLQRALARSGAAIKPDGMFGPDTTTILKIFQKANNLTPDGVAGTNTWRNLIAFLRPSELALLLQNKTSEHSVSPINEKLQANSPENPSQALEVSFNSKQKISIKEIQQALFDAGLDPGTIDGIRGRKTIKAIKEFQISHGLAVDGLVGLKTRTILFTNSNPAQREEFAIPNTMPWLETAYSLIGTQEKPGAGSNEAIMGWADALELTSYNDDDIPWCGLFVAHCIGSQMPEEALPNNPLGARKWQGFGEKISPRLGAIMVFWRGSPAGWKGHVGFYWAEDNDAYHIIGGNQANTVNVTRVSKNRLLSARWPSTGLSVDGFIRTASANGKLISINEA